MPSSPHDQWFISLAFANILDLIRDSKDVKGVWVLYVFAFVVSSIWVRGEGVCVCSCLTCHSQILQSLVLAVIYNVYRKIEDARIKAKEERITAELKAAFKRLDKTGQGYLATDVITQLFEAVR